MAQSFFERLTGSLRVRGDGDDIIATPAAVSRSEVSPRSRRVREFPERRVVHPVTEEAHEMPTITPIDAEPDEEGELTVDIYDEGVNIVVQSTVAGVKPEDIDISLEESTLTIRGSRRRQAEVQDESFYAKELYWGAFSRSIILPEEVDFQKAQAALKNGLLTVRLPKRDRGAKKLQVKSND